MLGCSIEAENNIIGVSSSTENGREQLDLVEIANVIPDGEGGFDFMYLPGESDATTWPSELSIYGISWKPHSCSSLSAPAVSVV